MKIQSIKNTVNGIFFGGINKIVTIVMPFIIRSIIIHQIGAEYAGLSGLFTSILKVLNMAELGFSSAATFSLYKPIAEEDTDKVCALLCFYRKIFYSVGAIVLGGGLLLIPFLHLLIDGSYPADINLKVIYIIYLIDSAASYFLFSYKNMILNAYQRVDVITIISTVTHMVTYAIQILLLIVFKSFYAYSVLIVACSVANNLFTARYVSKKFPQYTCKGKLVKAEKKNIIKNTYGMLLFKICQVTRNSLDSIFISAFLGLTAVAIYDSYYLIFAGIVSIQFIIRESMKGGIGNKIALNSPEKNHQDMLVFMYLYAWLSSICTACMLCLYQPFVKLWVGADMMLDEATMIMFCVYFYVTSMGSIRYLYHQAAGLFWTKRYWTVAETVVNLVGNFILIRRFGLIGVVCSTIISLISIDFFYSTTIVYDHYFKNGKIGVYFRKHGIYVLITAAGCVPAYFVCKMISLGGITGLVVKLMVCLAISNLIFFVGYRFLPEYSDAKKIAGRVFKMIRKKAIGK